jgi:hypothetical protein
MPSDSFRVRPGVVKAVVLESLSAASSTYDDREALAAEVRRRIDAALRSQGQAAPA